MKIQIIGLDQEEIPTFENAEALLAAAPGLGLTHTGTETAEHLLPVLRGLPKFKELAGPMGDGKPIIRYETWAAYDIYSR